MKVQLLTMAPKSWSIQETAMKFGVSERMIKIIKVRKEKGICAMLNPKVGKPLPQEVVDKIQVKEAVTKLKVQDQLVK